MLWQGERAIGNETNMNMNARVKVRSPVRSPDPYAAAGSVGMTIMEAGADAGAAAGGNGWTHVAQVACGFAFAVVSGAYVARLATDALKDVEEEMNSIEEQEMNSSSSSSSAGTD